MAPDMMPERILVIGASVRAAAMSISRSGRVPVAVDMFADSDLAEICETRHLANYPAGLPNAVNDIECSAWMYTGGLENYPELVDAIAADKKLLGVSGQALRSCRDPQLVEAALCSDGLPCPRTRLAKSLDDQIWLRKSVRSTGGAGIDLATNPPAKKRDCYFQQFIEGASHSAVYVASSHGATLFGVTEQLVGTSWLGARDFRYAGSINSAELSADTFVQFERIGCSLARSLGLVGLFGVDAIVNDHGVWPVEINPRYTASVEVLERCFSASAVDLHIRACCGDDSERGKRNEGTRRFGKGIVFADRNLCLSETPHDAVRHANSREPSPVFADIPHPNTSIKEGWPIATVFAEGATRAEVVEKLKTRADELRSFLDDRD